VAIAEVDGKVRNVLERNKITTAQNALIRNAIDVKKNGRTMTGRRRGYRAENKLGGGWMVGL